MPRPQFITCQLCGRGFGSASINIHIPQCYEKALKRWKIDPTGPRPVMPPLHGSAAATKKMGGGGATMSSSNAGFGEQPRGGGVSAARSLQGQNPQPFTEDAPANMNLHPCSKCGRNFNFDRITYHESVCKGDRKRRVFDSSKQRRATADGEDGFGGGFGGSTYGKGGKKRQLGVAATTSRYTPAPAPQTNWRQQHEEFINAIRSAKRADSESQNMWGTSSAAAPGGRAPVAPSRGPQRAPYTRSTNAGTGFGGAATSTRGMPQPAQRVPPLMTKQSESRRQNIASGGRAAQAKSSVPLGPPQGRSTRPANRASQQQRSSFGGGSADRFGGRGYGMGGGGGGGGGGRVVNDNTSSLGMLQALGQA